MGLRQQQSYSYTSTCQLPLELPMSNENPNMGRENTPDKRQPLSEAKNRRKGGRRRKVGAAHSPDSPSPQHASTTEESPRQQDESQRREASVDSSTGERLDEITAEFQPRPLHSGDSPPAVEYTKEFFVKSLSNPMMRSESLLANPVAGMKKAGDVSKLGWILKSPVGVTLTPQKESKSGPSSDMPTHEDDQITPLSEAYENDMGLITTGVCENVFEFELRYDIRIPEGVNLIAMPPAYHYDRSCVIPTMLVGPDDPRDQYHPITPRIRVDTAITIRQNTPVAQLLLVEDVAPSVDSETMNRKQRDMIRTNDEKVMEKFEKPDSNWYRERVEDTM